MKYNSIETKLELYYDKLKNPDKIIDNWAIIDMEAFNKFKKITLINFNEINNYPTERIITTESKNNYIIIKYSPDFIATKVIETEYDYNIEEWDLIAIDRNHLYSGNPSRVMTDKEIIKLLGFKLNKKAKLDLDYFS